MPDPLRTRRSTLSISERLYQQRLLIAYVREDGTQLERIWLPILRLAHRLTLREAHRGGLDDYGVPLANGDAAAAAFRRWLTSEKANVSGE